MAERSSTSSSSAAAAAEAAAAAAAAAGEPPAEVVQHRSIGEINRPEPGPAPRSDAVAHHQGDAHPPRRRFRFPWALLGALLIIAGVEAYLHTVDWRKHVPYDLGSDEYHAVATRLDVSPPAEVAFVGSSRVREGVVVPDLRREIEKAVGHPVTVANYACSGGNAYDDEAVIRRLLRAEPKPKVIIVGVAERDFAWRADEFERGPVFWNFDDWLNARRARGLGVVTQLPVVIRSWLGHYFYTLGRREQVRLSLRMRVLKETPWPSPVDGQLTPWQKIYPTMSLARKPVTTRRVKQYTRELFGHPYPERPMVDALSRALVACRAAGVPVVMYEVPVPAILRRYLPPGMHERYKQEMDQVAAKTGTPFMRVTDLGLAFTDNEFREQSHLNYAGADMMGDALAARVIVPVLAGGEVKRATPEEVAQFEKAQQEKAAREKAAQDAAPRKPAKRKRPGHGK